MILALEVGLFPVYFRFSSRPEGRLCRSLRAQKKLEGNARILSLAMTTTKKRRVEITFFEQERVVRRSITAHCSVCRMSSEILTPQEAGDLARVDLERIYQWLAQGRAHLVRTSRGDERVCRNSLFL